MREQKQEKEMLKQLSQRQENFEKQLLQTLQQAMSALLLAQQQLKNHLSFQQKLRATEDDDSLLNLLEFDYTTQNSNEKPSWLGDQPPELQ